MAEEKKGWFESTQKSLGLCKEILQSALIMILSIFAITSLAYPPWAHSQLNRLGIEIKEINVAGIKVVVNQSIELSESLAEASLSLASAREALKLSASKTEAISASNAVDAAIKRVTAAQSALKEQSLGTKELQKKAGVQPDLPQSAWITVGRLTAGDQLLPPAHRIDGARTKISDGRVKVVTLKQDAIVHDVDDCTVTEIANVQPVSKAELQKVVVVLSAGSYDVIDTHACPTRDGAQMISARVQINADRVRFAKFADSKS